MAGVVLVGTGIAGLFGKLPGCEPAPYIIRFTEDRPNPLYRRICYTTAWGEVVAFAVLNTAGLAVRDRHRRVAAEADVRVVLLSDRRHDVAARRARPAAARQALDRRRRPRAPLFLRLGVGGDDRPADPVVHVEGAAAQHDRFDIVKLVVFVGILAFVGNMARLGLLPRTRPIVPGELAVSD